MALRVGIDSKIKRVSAKINKSEFFAAELLLAFFSKKPRIRILFSSRLDRERNIRRGFKLLSHQIVFDTFTPENIKANDLVVPLTMDDLNFLTQHPQLAKNNPIPIPSQKAVNICDDKYLFSKTLIKSGFGTMVPRIGKNLPYPYMLKKKVAEGGNNCYIITDRSREQNFNNLISDPDYFCQQIIQDKNEYATHILFKDQKVVASINIKYVFANGQFVKGKDKFVCTTISGCPYLDIFADILDAIGFEGLCCVNYKVKDGKPYVFEINPRFGGSLSTFFFSFLRRLNLQESLQITPKPRSLFGMRNFRKAG